MSVTVRRVLGGSFPRRLAGHHEPVCSRRLWFVWTPGVALMTVIRQPCLCPGGGRFATTNKVVRGGGLSSAEYMNPIAPEFCWLLAFLRARSRRVVLPSTIGVIAFWSCRLVLRPGRRPSRLRPRIHLGYDPITALASYDNVLSVRPLVFKAGRFAQSRAIWSPSLWLTCH